ncbi:MAG: twin-arginine translocation signal domain-containing protein, partial [Planctomycetota bacterium]
MPTALTRRDFVRGTAAGLAMGVPSARAGHRSTLIGKAHFQTTANPPEFLSVESWDMFRKLDFLRTFNETHTPWYGFDRFETARIHANEGNVVGHDAVGMEDQGFSEWRDFFKKPCGGIDATTDTVYLRTIVTDTHKLTVYRGRPWGELFDLKNESGELNNLFDDDSADALK